jgi:hypothetical protein
MTQQNYRSSADNELDDREMETGEGKSGGNAGAGKSGTESLGSEKTTEDERFGSSKPDHADDGIDDQGKKTHRERTTKPKRKTSGPRAASMMPEDLLLGLPELLVLH